MRSLGGLCPGGLVGDTDAGEGEGEGKEDELGD